MSSNQYVSDEIREKSYNLLLSNIVKYNGLVEGIIFSEEELEDMAFKMENGVYDNYSITKNYKPQIRTVIANMAHTPNSPMVRYRLFTGEWSAELYGSMTSKDMYPELQQQMLDEADEKTRLDKYFLDKKLENDSMYTCGKCKSKKVEHIQVQTRSADEPMTVKACCLICGNRWKM